MITDGWPGKVERKTREGGGPVSGRTVGEMKLLEWNLRLVILEYGLPKYHQYVMYVKHWSPFSYDLYVTWIHTIERMWFGWKM